MKKVFLLIVVLLLLLSVPVAAGAQQAVETVSTEYEDADADLPLETGAPAAAIGQTLEIKAKSAILMEPITGKVLYEANADEQLPPASITKIMSLLLVMEALDRGDFAPDTVVTASEHACSMGGSQIWLEPGETMTVDELLRATVIASANDACVALGELVAGSEEGFVAQMNARAKELGMKNTVFQNCTGLDAEGHLTTAYDVALMSSALIRHEQIKQYSTVWMDHLRDGKSELVNTNKLVRFYEGATGLKTGTTGAAKYCLSATAKRDNLELVAVVMAGESSNDRFAGAKKLLDYGFANYRLLPLTADTLEYAVTVKNGVPGTITASAEETQYVLLPKSAAGELVQKAVTEDAVEAPVKKGDRVGSVSFYYGDECVGEIPIIAKEGSKRVTFGFALWQVLKGMLQL